MGTVWWHAQSAAMGVDSAKGSSLGARIYQWSPLPTSRPSCLRAWHTVDRRWSIEIRDGLGPADYGDVAVEDEDLDATVLAAVAGRDVRGDRLVGAETGYAQSLLGQT